MTTPVNYSLSVSSSEAQGQDYSNISMNTTDMGDLMRLLQLCGDGMDKNYNLNINSSQDTPMPNGSVTGSQNVSIQTRSKSDLMRLLQMAGVKGEEHPSECTCDVCGADGVHPEGCQCADCTHDDSCTCDECVNSVTVMEQQAAYDYGHQDYIENQDEFTITDYNFRGRADLPERPTDARFGSNALRNDMKESAYEKMRNAYESFLAEADEMNPGELSPLTSTDRDEFDKDPLHTEKVVDDGSRSPLSRVKLQNLPG